MVTLEIDGKRVTVKDGLNLVQAAEGAGIEIPHYCFHPGLSIRGSCRMCLVEIEKMPRLQIACNTRVGEGMVVWTQNERVKKARAGVLEFLLINHPIDCPVCDQAGECKLQDYYMEYDQQGSRVALNEKVKKGKALDVGRMIMLDQERCILCTRCVRFCNEVSKTGELGVTERGDHCRISLFPERRLDNPYSGNVADICPVGALTNKAFRFQSRVWYLDHTPSVCPTCATGCNMDIYHRGNDIFRCRPRHNDGVNAYWMCDEGRLSFRNQQGEGRLLQPVARSGGGWSVARWDDMLGSLANGLREIVSQGGASAIGGIVSAKATNEEAFLFARLIRDTLKGQVAGFAWSPPDAFSDDYLIDADKNPNSAGLRALGIEADATKALLEQASSGQLKALVMLRCDFSESHGQDVLNALAKQVGLLVVIDTHHHATADAADVLLPIASFAETDGTFVNRKGHVQRIRPAVDAPGEARAGWQLLADLVARLGSGEVPSAAADVFGEIARSVPAFLSLSYSAIGDHGAPIQDSATA